MIEIDHLVLTAPSLGEGQDYVEARLGARPVFRGRHPQLGTETALLGLGPRTYLEVIAIADDAKGKGITYPFDLENCTTPTLTTWCARTTEFTVVTAAFKQIGFDLGEMREGRRETPQGDTLRWLFTDIYADRLGGAAPFLIEWGDCHPCDTLPVSGQLLSLEVQYSGPEIPCSISLPTDIIITAAEQTKLRGHIQLLDGKQVWLD